MFDLAIALANASLLTGVTVASGPPLIAVLELLYTTTNLFLSFSLIDLIEPDATPWFTAYFNASASVLTSSA